MGVEPVVLDAFGLRCPMPVQLIRKALRNLQENSTLHVLGDDPESLHDIPALLARLGLPPAEIIEIEGGWRFVIRNS